MPIEEALSRKLEKFLFETLWLDGFQGYIIGNFDGGRDSLLEKIKVFISNHKLLDHQQYLIRRILYHVRAEEFDENEAINSKNVESERSVFEENKQHLLDELTIIADQSNISISDEHLTKEEFNKLIRKIDDISETLYELAKRQNAANEIIYNSTEELRDDLVSILNKSRIFGKKFTFTNLACRIAVLTGNTAFGYVLEKGLDNMPQAINILIEGQ